MISDYVNIQQMPIWLLPQSGPNQMTFWKIYPPSFMICFFHKNPFYNTLTPTLKNNLQIPIKLASSNIVTLPHVEDPHANFYSFLKYFQTNFHTQSWFIKASVFQTTTISLPLNMAHHKVLYPLMPTQPNLHKNPQIDPHGFPIPKIASFIFMLSRTHLWFC